MSRAAALVVAVSLVATACGSTGNAEVSSLSDGGSSASAPAESSASASGVAPSEEVSGTLGAYSPVSDVSTHAQVSLDLCAIDDLLPKDAPLDYEAIETVYVEGINSVKGDGTIRALAGFGRQDRDEDIWNEYTAYYRDEQWLDTFVMSAIEGTGPFEGEADLVRRQGIAKGISEQVMIAWVFHEMVAAIGKAAEGNIDPGSGAPHNWDEAWAFYHGEAPDCGPFATADSRGENFGRGTAVNDALAEAFQAGSDALVDGNIAGARTALAEIKRLITITYVQATIRYAHKIDGALAEGDMEGARKDQAEGWTRYRVIEPFVSGVDPDVAATIAAQYDLGATDPQEGSGDIVQGAIESVYAGLGITAEDIGELVD